MTKLTKAQLVAENEALRAQLATLQQLLDAERAAQPAAPAVTEARARYLARQAAKAAEPQAPSEFQLLHARAKALAMAGKKVRIVGRELIVG